MTDSIQPGSRQCIEAIQRRRRAAVAAALGIAPVRGAGCGDAKPEGAAALPAGKRDGVTCGRVRVAFAAGPGGHADSLPPPQALDLIGQALADGWFVGGAFEHAFCERDWRLRMISCVNRVRYR